MTATINIKTLYERLAEIGIPQNFVRQQALPDWWNNDCEQTPGSAIEAAIYISSRLNLDFKSLVKAESRPRFNQISSSKFKVQAGSLPDELIAPYSISARVAEIVASACKPNFQALPDSPKLIRDEILKNRPTVNLEGLLNYCWNIGIPVVRFKKFPKSTHKFDGMVAFFGGCPVIVISHRLSSAAWLLFVLAHELGHIGSKHITEACIVDEQIKLESVDIEEIEASEYAAEILIGRQDIIYYTPRNFDGEQLAEYGKRMFQRDNVDPGVVILNYAWNKARTASKKEKGIIWATASKALQIVEGNINAPRLINNLAFEHLDLDILDGDSQDYLNFALLE